jgi:hypothetical protein
VRGPAGLRVGVLREDTFWWKKKNCMRLNALESCGIVSPMFVIRLTVPVEGLLCIGFAFIHGEALTLQNTTLALVRRVFQQIYERIKIHEAAPVTQRLYTRV